MASTSADKDSTDPFEDCTLSAEDILGEREFSGRLYSPEKAQAVMNADVRTGEQTHQIPTADAVEEWIAEKNEESRKKADEKSWHSHTDHVALVPASGEQLAESGSLLSHAAFFHMAVTSTNLHFAYSAASRSDEFDVTYEADYETGTVTISVERD